MTIQSAQEYMIARGWEAEYHRLLTGQDVSPNYIRQSRELNRQPIRPNPGGSRYDPEACYREGVGKAKLMFKVG